MEAEKRDLILLRDIMHTSLEVEIMMIISISRAALATSKNQSVARATVYLIYYVNPFWRIFTKI